MRTWSLIIFIESIQAVSHPVPLLFSFSFTAECGKNTHKNILFSGREIGKPGRMVPSVDVPGSSLHLRAEAQKIHMHFKTISTTFNLSKTIL